MTDIWRFTKRVTSYCWISRWSHSLVRATYLPTGKFQASDVLRTELRSRRFFRWNFDRPEFRASRRAHFVSPHFSSRRVCTGCLAIIDTPFVQQVYREKFLGYIRTKHVCCLVTSLEKQIEQSPFRATFFIICHFSKYTLLTIQIIFVFVYSGYVFNYRSVA